MTAKDRTFTSLPSADTEVLLNGRYRMGEELGRGTAGHVFAAHDLLLGRAVAVKVLDGLPDAVATGRALRAVSAASRCRHAHLIGLLDAEHGRPAFVVLERVVDAHPLDVAALAEDAARTVADDVLAALAALHAGAAVHRDVHAGNVLVDADGRAFLTAAGLTAAGHDPSLGLRLVGEDAEQTLDARADVAAAALLVRSLLGPDLGPHLDAVLRRAVSPDPLARPEDAEALRMLVTDAIEADERERTPSRDEPGFTASTPAPSRQSGPSRLGRLALLLAAVAAAALLIVIPFVDGGSGEPAGPRLVPAGEVAGIVAQAGDPAVDPSRQMAHLLRRLGALAQLRGAERAAEVARLYGSARVLEAAAADAAPLAAEVSAALQPELTLGGVVALAEADPAAVGPLAETISPRLRALEGLVDEQRAAEADGLRQAAEQGLSAGQLTPEFHAALRFVLDPIATGA